MIKMGDPFTYYVPQTPCDSSCRNSFFQHSSPTCSTRFINSVQDVSTRIRNIGKATESEQQPLQNRVSSLEDTLESVHTTMAKLETAMGDIAQLLKSKTVPEPATPTPRTSSPMVINHSTHPITTNRLSYCDSTKQVVTPTPPTMTPVSMPPPPPHQSWFATQRLDRTSTFRIRYEIANGSTPTSLPTVHLWSLLEFMPIQHP
jgi:hypothetical protein